MPTRRQLIQKITLNSDANSITFSNIPQNYTDLKIIYSASADNDLYVLWLDEDVYPGMSISTELKVLEVFEVPGTISR